MSEKGQSKRTMSGLEIISQLRKEEFNITTEQRLQSHPYLKAAKDGTLTLSQRQAFAQEQFFVQCSDAISFASLAGHSGFIPTVLSETSLPDPVRLPGSHGTILKEMTTTTNLDVDLFQFLLGGELYASSLLLKYARSLDLDEDALRSHRPSALAQGYPSYWAQLAVSKKRAAGAAACAVNFPAWGEMCRQLCEALGKKTDESGEEVNNYGYSSESDEALAFIKFFANPIENLDLMAAIVIEEEGASFEELVEPVRLLQEYELMFWDAIFHE